MDLAKYVALFLAESREHLGACNELLLEWERAPAATAPVDGLFRAMHTVKGMAATLGYAGVADLAHRTENLLDTIRGRRLAPSGGTFELLFRAIDALVAAAETAAAGGEELRDEQLLAALDRAAGRAGSGGEGQLEAASRPDSAPLSEMMDRRRGGRQIRVDLRRLDTLMRRVGELVVARHRLGALATAIGNPELIDASARVTRLTSDMQEEILAARMTPVGEIFDRFPRLVRDLARNLGKQIRLEIEGADIELDRSVLDEIGEPLLHLVRNAADHGIERPGDRLAAGKPAEGCIVLSALRERSSVIVRVSDDGRGIDRAAIVARARREGLAEAEAETLSDDALMRLLARPGFSTADAVSDVSGRGVGVDVVMTRMRALGGTIDVRSEPGRGATFTLRVPLTLAIVRVLLADAGGERYAIPLTYVSETVELDPNALTSLRGCEAVVLRDLVVPTVHLRQLVGADGPAPRRRPTVILEIGDRRAALVVDALVGQQEIVVERFDAPRDMLPVIGGATILADGMPALILDAAAIL